jgi:hypothetical protein
MWKPQRLTTLWAFYRDSFTLSFTKLYLCQLFTVGNVNVLPKGKNAGFREKVDGSKFEARKMESRRGSRASHNKELSTIHRYYYGYRKGEDVINVIFTV